MNNSTLLGGIAALVVIGGLIFYIFTLSPNSQTNIVTSTSGTSDTGGTDSTGQGQQPGAPIVTTNSSAAPTDTTAVISGTANPNGAFTNYWFEYGTTVNLGSKTSSQSVGSGYVVIPTPAYLTGLTKDTTYYFRVVAENQYGKIAGTQYAFHTTQGTPAPVGSAPVVKTLAASGISRTTANLGGEVTPNRAATQEWFEYGKTSDLGKTTAFVGVGDGSAKVPASISLSDLDPATTYYFRLNAQNQFGTVNGAILNFKTAGPSAAQAPSVSTRNAADVGTSTARLRGTVGPNGAETNYWFEYSTDSLLGAASLKTTNQASAGAGTNQGSVEADISALSPKTTYYFRIAAQNSLGTVRGDRETFKTK